MQRRHEFLISLLVYGFSRVLPVLQSLLNVLFLLSQLGLRRMWNNVVMITLETHQFAYKIY